LPLRCLSNVVDGILKGRCPSAGRGTSGMAMFS
jgi:hypothetical protein